MSEEKEVLQNGGDSDNQSQPVEIVPDYSPNRPPVYSNYAVVSHSPTEMFVDFCLIQPPFVLIEGEKSLKAPTVASVILTKEVARGLKDALEQQLARTQESSEATTAAIASEMANR